MILKEVLALAVLISLSSIAIAQKKPKVSFTFDDGMLYDRPGYPFEVWNNMLLAKLEEAGVTATSACSG